MMNDEERRLWVLNYEKLYLWWGRPEQSILEFVRRHRAGIDRIVTADRRYGR